MMIAPGEAGSDARGDPTPDIGALDSACGWSLRSSRNGHSADTADKARTTRLQGGTRRAAVELLQTKKRGGRVWRRAPRGVAGLGMGRVPLFLQPLHDAFGSLHWRRVGW